METLTEIWERLYSKSDKGDVHSYLEVYEQKLEPYRESAKRVLEVGLFNGASLRMWGEYFHIAALHGIDCDIRPHGGLGDLRPIIAEGIYDIHIMDAESEEQVKRVFDGMKFDVIIEDAGHHLAQQLKIYHVLRPYLNEGGIYIIEDIQDIDVTRKVFEQFDEEKQIEILDRRHIKNRYDDVMVIIRDK